MTDDNPETGAPTAEAMARVNARVCRYRCGECPYDETATWEQHSAHYDTHRRVA